MSPFGGANLAASHSIQNTNHTIAKQLDLGNHPVNARNLNVQSVMAESNNQIEPNSIGGGAMQVNLRKTFNMPNNGQNAQQSHYATINGETTNKLNQSVIVSSDKQKGKVNLNDSIVIIGGQTNPGIKRDP